MLGCVVMLALTAVGRCVTSRLRRRKYVSLISDQYILVDYLIDLVMGYYCLIDSLIYC